MRRDYAGRGQTTSFEKPVTAAAAGGPLHENPVTAGEAVVPHQRMSGGVEASGMRLRDWLADREFTPRGFCDGKVAAWQQLGKIARDPKDDENPKPSPAIPAVWS